MIPSRPPSTDPYQWFFPLGVVSGLLGTGIWVAFWRHGIAGYPAVIHADLMMGGFFLTVAVGFLMTAIPKFTGTAAASLTEKMMVALCVGAGLGSAYAQQRLPYHAALLAMTVCLVLFAVRRFARSTFRVPPPFAFLGFGIISALLSTLLLTAQGLAPLPGPLAILGRQLFIYGTSLFLILGVGTQLIPFFMGMVNTDEVQPRTPFHIRTGLSPVGVVVAWATILLATFIMDAFEFQISAGILRAAVVGWILVARWKILHWPKAGTLLSIMIWVASWMTLSGFCVMAVSPAFAVHGAHLYFIGGVSLLIFSVATRVSLAHGGHGLVMERRSWILMTVLILLVLSALTRVTAPWLPETYVSHLAYAAIAWMLAAFTWMSGLLPKMWRRKPVP